MNLLECVLVIIGYFLPIAIFFVCKVKYDKRVESNEEGMRRYALRLWSIMIMAFLADILVVNNLTKKAIHSEICFQCGIWALIGTAFLLYKVLLGKKQMLSSAIIHKLEENEKIKASGIDTVPVFWIRERDFPMLQREITKVLEVITEEAAEISDHSIEILVHRRYKCYGIGINYFELKQEISVFQSERKIIANIVERLEETYKVKRDSGEHWECAEIRLPIE